MSESIELRPNETLMTHFIMRAPPPSMPSEVAARGLSEGLTLRALKPDYDQILEELEKIGDGWHLRDEHTDESRRDKTRKLLESSRASTWHFMRDGEPIGFCVAVKKGFCKNLPRIVENFNRATENPDYRLNPNRGTEIYKVGLYEEFIGKAYGHNFLPGVQVALLNGQLGVESEGIEEIKPSDFIYLNTRLTNRVDSRQFYQKLGYAWAGEERWLISTSEVRGLQQVSGDMNGHDSHRRPLIPAAAGRVGNVHKPRPLIPSGAFPKMGMAGG